VGGTASGSPAAGTWVTGDWVVAQNGVIWICTAGGTPGTWTDASTVESVAGRTGAVTLTAADIGAGTFPAGAFVFNGAVSGVTTLGTTGLITLTLSSPHIVYTDGSDTVKIGLATTAGQVSAFSQARDLVLAGPVRVFTPLPFVATGSISTSSTVTGTALIPAGLTGATTATRYVGGTATVAPTTGTFVIGDYVISQNAKLWVCTAGGSPGTWVAATTGTSATTVTAMNSFGLSSVVGTSGNFAREDHVHSTPATPVTTAAGTANQILASASTGAVTLSLANGVTFPVGTNIMQGPTSGVGLQIKAAATTPGNIQEWQTSGGSTVAKIDSGGGIYEGTSHVYSAVNANLSGTVTDNTTYGLSSTAGSATTYSRGDHSHGTTPWPLWKDPVVGASVGNVVIASGLVNGTVIDGVSLATGDRYLLKNQTAPAENGIYIVAASGAASRAPDADTQAELFGMSVYVIRGLINAGSFWNLDNTGSSIVLGTTGLVYVSPQSAWTSYTPTFTNITSGAGSFFYKKIGKTGYLRGNFTAGTATAAAVIQISLPTGWTAVVATVVGAQNNNAAVGSNIVSSGTTVRVAADMAFANWGVGASIASVHFNIGGFELA